MKITNLAQGSGDCEFFWTPKKIKVHLTPFILTILSSFLCVLPVLCAMSFFLFPILFYLVNPVYSVSLYVSIIAEYFSNSSSFPLFLAPLA